MTSRIAVLALLLWMPIAAGGQPSTLTEGARIRVTAPTVRLKNHVTTLRELREDIIVIDYRGVQRTLPLASVEKLEVSSGKRTTVKRNAVRGLVLGLVTGAVVGYAGFEKCVPEQFMDCFMMPTTRGESAATYATLFGVVGGTFGALSGLHRSDIWTPVRRLIRPVVMQSISGGVHVALSLTL